MVPMVNGKRKEKHGMSFLEVMQTIDLKCVMEERVLDSHVESTLYEVSWVTKRKCRDAIIVLIVLMKRKRHLTKVVSS